jgi:hypothetical protein
MITFDYEGGMGVWAGDNMIKNVPFLQILTKSFQNLPKIFLIFCEIFFNSDFRKFSSNSI